eukprot:SAG11_NODE_1802_length_4237_cov_4.045916_3_plen_125_part_00
MPVYTIVELTSTHQFFETAAFGSRFDHDLAAIPSTLYPRAVAVAHATKEERWLLQCEAKAATQEAAGAGRKHRHASRPSCGATSATAATRRYRRMSNIFCRTAPKVVALGQFTSPLHLVLPELL